MEKIQILLFELLKSEVNDLLDDFYIKRTSLYTGLDPRTISAFVKGDDLNISELSRLLGDTSINNFDDIHSFLDFYHRLGRSFDENNFFLALPAYKYLFDTKNLAYQRLAASFFLDLHFCSDVKNCLYFDNKSIIKDGGTYLRMIDNYYNSLRSDSVFYSLNEAIRFINYLELEEKNPLSIGEYRKELDKIRGRILSFIEFYSNDDMFCEFLNNPMSVDVSSNYDYKTFNTRLVKHFFNIDLSDTNNKLFSLEKFENTKLFDGQDKIKLLVCFCYKKFRYNKDFYDNFSDVSLSLEDVKNFIEECEKHELLGDYQLENLFCSYRDWYLRKNGLEDLRNKEVDIVKNAYREFSKSNYYFTLDKFIKYFNDNNPIRFKTFGFDGSESVLTIDICNEIFYDFIDGFSCLDDYDCRKKFVNTVKRYDADSDLFETEEKKRIYEKFYPYISMYFTNNSNYTLRYFIRVNTSLEEYSKVCDLFDWYLFSNDIVFEDTEEAKDNTFKAIISDMEEELRCCHLDERDKLLDKYREYLITDMVSGKDYLKKLNSKYKSIITDKFKMAQNIVTNIFTDSINKGENAIINCRDKHISRKDLALIVKKIGNPEFTKKYEMDAEELQIISKKETYISDKKALEVVGLIESFLITDSSLMIEDFLSDKMIARSTFLEYARKLKNDGNPTAELFYQENKRRKDYRDGLIGIDNVEEIFYKIANGVTFDAGVRDYTYFDMLIDIGRVVPISGVHKNFLDSSRYNTVPFYDWHGVKRFFNKYGSDGELSYWGINSAGLASYMNNDYKFNISGILYDVTDDDKKVVHDYIVKNRMPAFVFFDALYAYVRGDYDLKNMPPVLRKTTISGNDVESK